ncbi:septum site-determining protein MinC [Rhizobium sp. LjRoot254]|uniref:septum site-determining protein MinC n=1 Tax=Rhizobium sp. LjRoot254 TaxID=3342297 RepID=UPI003ED12CBF
MSDALTDARSIRIKGKSFLAVVLTPEMPLDQWLAGLDNLAARSAGFFLERPVVLDVTDLAVSKHEFKHLLGELSTRSVRIMGIEGARPSMLEPGMPPIMKGGRPGADIEVHSVTSAVESKAEPQFEIAEASRAPVAVPALQQSIVIRQPVRSGQSIIYPEGDVTIIGSVASGAEVIAGGSVHIYGTLRGRAIAGTLGNASASIFCRKLEAELLSIDGIYTTADQFTSDLQGQAVHLWLDGDEMKIQKIA